jgi:hypothetical protein
MSILLGSLNLNGSITASGDLRFSSTGSGIVASLTNITLSGTASFTGSTDVLFGTNTTTYLQYGINLISSGSATSSSYCCRLPLVPKTGKEVTVINNSGCEVLIFPSMEDGDINGFVNGNIIIPPNNQAYTFVCYENPLPGGWSVTNLPNGSTQVWDTAGIDAPAFNTAFGFIAYINPTDESNILSALHVSTGVKYEQFSNLILSKSFIHNIPRILVKSQKSL